MLVLSDIVIADVSIYNANVFYELGIRHGLQDRHTLLIRAEGSKDKYPFDLQTDRYFVYDPAEPGKKLPAFLEALRSTLASIGKDSPVFQLLPRLKPHDRQALMVVPWDFQEDVERAQKARRAGDLRLLAEEARGFEWGSARTAGRGRRAVSNQAPLPEPRRPLKRCGALIPTIFRPTTASARSIRSLRNQRSTWTRSSIA